MLPARLPGGKLCERESPDGCKPPWPSICQVRIPGYLVSRQLGQDLAHLNVQAVAFTRRGWFLTVNIRCQAGSGYILEKRQTT